MKPIYFRLLPILCLFALLLQSCEEDIVKEQNPQTNTLPAIQSSIVSLENFNADAKFAEKLNEFNQGSKGVVKKKAYSSKYNFWVDTDKILMLSRGNYISYTLPVYRDKEKPGVIENLFLHPYNGKYLSF